MVANVRGRLEPGGPRTLLKSILVSKARRMQWVLAAKVATQNGERLCKADAVDSKHARSQASDGETQRLEEVLRMASGGKCKGTSVFHMDMHTVYSI